MVQATINGQAILLNEEQVRQIYNSPSQPLAQQPLAQQPLAQQRSLTYVQNASPDTIIREQALQKERNEILHVMEQCSNNKKNIMYKFNLAFQNLEKNPLPGTSKDQLSKPDDHTPSRRRLFDLRNLQQDEESREKVDFRSLILFQLNLPGTVKGVH